MPLLFSLFFPVSLSDWFYESELGSLGISCSNSGSSSMSFELVLLSLFDFSESSEVLADSYSLFFSFASFLEPIVGLTSS